MKLKSLIVVLLCIVVCSSCEQPPIEAYAVLPQPQEINYVQGFVKLKDKPMVVYSNELSNEALLLASYLKNDFAVEVTLEEGKDKGDVILLLDSTVLPDKKGGYVLEAAGSQITIKASTPEGVFNGVQTLRQIIKEREGRLTVQKALVTDYPAFSWRAFMLDEGRYFKGKEVVLNLLDRMAELKMNVFHWHLTDDQGWRIEIEKYPLLTEKGAWRKFNKHDRGCMERAVEEDNTDFLIPENKIRIVEGDTLYGGYYTHEDIKEIVDYAAQRGIDVIPEIDMPGHMLAAISNYEGVSCFDETGWGTTFSSPVCPGKDSAIEFCKNVYSELIELYPYKYVHIGGDEVEKTNWKKCPDCQKRMRDNKLKTEEELQSWFIHDMEKFFNDKGKEMIGWDEIIEGGLSKTATVMWWRSWAKNAPSKTTGQGNPIIFTPNGQFYLDYQEDKNSVANIYNYDPMSEIQNAEMQPLVLGVQGNVWCEWIPSRERMQYMAIPRLLAIAELGWSNPSQKDWNAFARRLANQFERLNIMNINYRIPDLEGFNKTNAFIGEGIVNITCLDPSAEIHYTTDGSVPTLQSPKYDGPVKVTETTDFTFRTFRPNGKPGDITTTRFIKSEYTPAVTAAPSNPGLKATWHEFKGNKCTEIEKAPVNGNYSIEDVMIPKKVKGNIGLIIKGYINAPQDDIYTFALLSDDGSTLVIDGEQVIDNDGPHGPREVVGQKALAKGYHPIEIRYFDQNGGQLKMKVSGNDGKEIPFTHLYAH